MDNLLPVPGFTLLKSEFRDALTFYFSHNIKGGPPSKCPCRSRFDFRHAPNYKREGSVIMRSNYVADFEAVLLKKICNGVELEPTTTASYK